MTDDVPAGLQEKMNFGMHLLRGARECLPPCMGVTIIVHNDKLALAGLEMAVVTTLPSRREQRVVIVEALWRSGIADGDPDLALADHAAFDRGDPDE